MSVGRPSHWVLVVNPFAFMQRVPRISSIEHEHDHDQCAGMRIACFRCYMCAESRRSAGESMITMVTRILRLDCSTRLHDQTCLHYWLVDEISNSDCVRYDDRVCFVCRRVCSRHGLPIPPAPGDWSVLPVWAREHDPLSRSASVDYIKSFISGSAS